VGRLLIEKKYISWGELTDRLAEVQARYAGGLAGGFRTPNQVRRYGSNVERNRIHLEAVGIGDPRIFAGKAGPSKFKTVTAFGCGSCRRCSTPAHRNMRGAPKGDRRGHLRESRSRGRDLGP